MIWGYIYNKHRFLSTERQKEIITEYAQKYQFKPLRFRTINESNDIFSYNLQNEDTLIVCDILLFGSRFEDIISTFKCLSEKKIRICSISEDLMLDNLIPNLSHGILDCCLKIYKGTLSIKNKKIQANLLATGRDRGRPKGKTILDEKFEELKQLLTTDLTLTDIAKRMNINKTTLFAFLRRKNLKRHNI